MVTLQILSRYNHVKEHRLQQVDTILSSNCSLNEPKDHKKKKKSHLTKRGGGGRREEMEECTKIPQLGISKIPLLLA